MVQVDIAPTLALLFGVPIPKNNVGVLISEAFDLLTGQFSLSLSVICVCMLRYLIVWDGNIIKLKRSNKYRLKKVQIIKFMNFKC